MMPFSRGLSSGRTLARGHREACWGSKSSFFTHTIPRRPSKTLKLLGCWKVVLDDFRNRSPQPTRASSSHPATRLETRPLFNSSRRHGTVHPTAELGALPEICAFQFQVFASYKSASFAANPADWPL